MDYSTWGFPVHHQLPELAPTNVHPVGDTIQPSHPLLFPSPPVLHPSQHQGLFQWVSSSHQVAKGLELQLQLQHQSFQWIFRNDFLQDGLVDLCAVQGIFKSLLQNHSSKASILLCSAFFIVQLFLHILTKYNYCGSSNMGDLSLSLGTHRSRNREEKEYVKELHW